MQSNSFNGKIYINRQIIGIKLSNYRQQKADGSLIYKAYKAYLIRGVELIIKLYSIVMQDKNKSRYECHTILFFRFYLNETNLV